MASTQNALSDVSKNYSFVKNFWYIDCTGMASSQHVFSGVSQDYLFVQKFCYIDYSEILFEQF